MDAARWRQIERLFAAASEKPAAERIRHLEQECGTDTSLRREVEELLTTAEGTITALSEQFYLGLNQRASFRWQESTPSRMLIAPAVNLTGLAIRARSGAYTGTVTLTVKFME